jgi:carbonic anhydrase
MSATEESLTANKRYAESFTKGGRPLPPAKQLAIVACMGARIEKDSGAYSFPRSLPGRKHE